MQTNPLSSCGTAGSGYYEAQREIYLEDWCDDCFEKNIIMMPFVMFGAMIGVKKKTSIITFFFFSVKYNTFIYTNSSTKKKPSTYARLKFYLSIWVLEI